MTTTRHKRRRQLVTKGLVGACCGGHPPIHAKSADSEVLAKVLEMLSGMDARMRKMEALHARIKEDERMRGADESRLFTSTLEADFAGRLHRGAWRIHTSANNVDHRKFIV
uniref:Uncharacterized protein n=1 Tax=Peronospora matthiolae TaxID=2874970 RepID=A0AAV1VNE6_9STRA